jgi:hypothetical protein
MEDDSATSGQKLTKGQKKALKEKAKREAAAKETEDGAGATTEDAKDATPEPTVAKSGPKGAKGAKGKKGGKHTSLLIIPAYNITLTTHV